MPHLSCWHKAHTLQPGVDEGLATHGTAASLAQCLLSRGVEGHCRSHQGVPGTGRWEGGSTDACNT